MDYLTMLKVLAADHWPWGTAWIPSFLVILISAWFAVKIIHSIAELLQKPAFVQLLRQICAGLVYVLASTAKLLKLMALEVAKEIFAPWPVK